MGKKRKNRWICLILSILLAVIILAGCGNSGTGTAQETASAPAAAVENGQETAEGEPADTGPGTAEAEPAKAGTPETSLTLIETEPDQPETGPADTGPQESLPAIDEDGSYTTKEDVALYIHTYGRLPSNFITKKQAEKLGWSGGSLEPYAPGKCIGGNHYGNYEGLLPDGNYKECDIDTLGKKKRGAKRLIYSDDGRIYYTDDHYKTFTQLY